MKEVGVGDLHDLLLKQTPEEILEGLFTEVELENLINIKQEMSICIKWGVLTKHMYQNLLDNMDTLVFLETENEEPATVKRNPYESLFARDQAVINGPTDKAQISRKIVLLYLLKKLLGALKTHVNQELEQIKTINDSAEGELQEMILYGVDDPDEEEMDLVSELNDEDTTRGEILAVVDHRPTCMHRRTTIRQIPSTKTASRMDELHTFCKDCKAALGLQKMNTRTTLQRSREWLDRGPKVCYHPNGTWKEGEEGKTAICSSCKGVVPNPNKFRWEEVGLEPFGDDPELDEIQSFTNLKSVEA